MTKSLALVAGFLVMAISSVPLPSMVEARSRATAAARDAVAVAEPPRVGVFYYPGWGPDQSAKLGWSTIKPYPEREPALGWYRQDEPAVMAQQIKWMSDSGLSFVAFDWYFAKGQPRLDDALKAYMSIKQDHVGFSLLWANHDQPTTPAEMDAMAHWWISHYFSDPRYLKVDGRPVVFIFSFQKFHDDAISSGSTAAAYVSRANELARKAGLPGLYFVGGTDDLSTPELARDAVAAGLGAVGAYNLHRKPRSASNVDPNWWRAFHGYAQLDAAYRAQWEAGRLLPLPLVVPMSTGWDKRPWGGSEDPLHDRSIGTAAQFRNHLQAGREEMERQGTAHSGLGTICCWNEFGEGSFLEPTRKDGTALLDQVKQTFGASRP